MTQGKSKYILFSVSLIVATIVIYFPLKNFYFFGEDFNYLAHTRYTLSLGSPLEVFHVDFYGGMWFRPLNTLFWYLTWLICGLNPLHHYLVNIAILIATAFLLLSFAKSVGIPVSFAYLTALLFILHPLTSATISYLSARSDMLGAFFALLALSLWLAYARSRKSSWKYLSYLSAFFSYLFKEMFLCLPFMIMALPYGEEKKGDLKDNVIIRVKRALPFLVLALVFLLWRAYVLRGAGGYFYKRTELIYNILLIPVNILKTILLLPQMFFIYPLPKMAGSPSGLFLKILFLLMLAIWLLFLFQRKKNGHGKILFAWLMLSLLPVMFYPDVLRESARLLYFPLMFTLLILLHFTASRKFLMSLFFSTLGITWFLLGRNVLTKQLRQTETYRSLQVASQRDILPQILYGAHHQTIVAFGVPPEIYSLDLVLFTTLPYHVDKNNPATTAVILLGDRSTYTGEFILPDSRIPATRFANVFDFYFGDDVLIFKGKNTISVHHRAPNIPLLFEQKVNPRIYYYDEKENKFADVTEIFSKVSAGKDKAIKSFSSLGFDFAEGVGDWQTNAQLNVIGSEKGTLKLKSLGNDPYMELKNLHLNPKAIKSFHLEMRVKKEGIFVNNITEGQISWESPLEPPFGLKKVFRFPVKADGEWHDYEIDIGRYAGWYLLEEINALRIDPVSCKAFIEIKTLEAIPYSSESSR